MKHPVTMNMLVISLCIVIVVLALVALSVSKVVCFWLVVSIEVIFAIFFGLDYLAFLLINVSF